ncbi:GlcNAc-PI de-N-acetylase [bacterium K02(2017)]|nr:GlcNAc-PI de-N-acetylase [bacterium K02(2017)]
MQKIIVIAPHPDDETLGCGGSLLKHKQDGDEIYWLICTRMTLAGGYTQKQIDDREKQIQEVNNHYGFKGLFQLDFPAAKLDTFPLSEIVSEFINIFKKVEPHTIYIPSKNDVHSDHKIISDIAISSSKCFRIPSVKRVLSYETLSETDFSLSHDDLFVPNYFTNIEPYLDKKIDILACYKGEILEPPFPRSQERLRALAIYRGGQAGFKAAEAFMLLKEIVS